MDVSRYNEKRKVSSHIGGRHSFSACTSEPFEKHKLDRSYRSENIRDICKEKCDNAIILLADRASESKVIKKTVKTTAKWIDVDDKEYRVEGEYKKIPFGVMCAIVVVAIILLLIVAGNIMVSQASMELWALENEYQRLEEYESEIESKLALKNDLRYIEYIAKTELGMIEREHADVMYIGSEPQDKVEAYDVYEKDKGSISALLYALGFVE